MTKKYEFIGETNERGLKKIRAIRSFGVINSGDIGGWISSEDNLSHEGDAWVSENALVSENACVCENACISGNARVSENAWVSGNVWVSGNACISGNARVYGNACISGNAKILSMSDYFVIGPAKSSGRFTTSYVDSKIGTGVTCGCFHGSIDEFISRINETHKDNGEYRNQYLFFAEMIKRNFDV